jgi:FMN reductase
VTTYADIVLIAGSPSATSRSARLLAALGERWTSLGLGVRQFGVLDFRAEDLLLAHTDAPEIQHLLEAVAKARAVVLATPVYKAIYSGALKTIVDLIAPDGLSGKAALGLATAKLESHLSSVSQAYAELFRFFRGSIALPTLYLRDDQLDFASGKLVIEPAVEARVQAAVDALASAIAR